MSPYLPYCVKVCKWIKGHMDSQGNNNETESEIIDISKASLVWTQVVWLMLNPGPKDSFFDKITRQKHRWKGT